MPDLIPYEEEDVPEYCTLEQFEGTDLLVLTLKQPQVTTLLPNTQYIESINNLLAKLKGKSFLEFGRSYTSE